MTLQDYSDIFSVPELELEKVMSIGLKIKKIRIGLNLSVKILSNQTGVSRSYLILIENGDRPLPKRLVEKVAEALKLPHKTVYEWYLEQELKRMGFTDKRSLQLIQRLLREPV